MEDPNNMIKLVDLVEIYRMKSPTISTSNQQSNNKHSEMKIFTVALIIIAKLSKKLQNSAFKKSVKLV